MKAAFMLLVLLVVGLTPGGSVMAGAGRYQAIVVPPTSQTANRPVIIILDTEEGHLWEKSLAEKPWYVGQVNPPAEKGFWQSIGDYLVVTPKPTGTTNIPEGKYMLPQNGVMVPATKAQFDEYVAQYGVPMTPENLPVGKAMKVGGKTVGRFPDGLYYIDAQGNKIGKYGQ